MVCPYPGRTSSGAFSVPIESSVRNDPPSGPIGTQDWIGTENCIGVRLSACRYGR
jgi:hypothetical protein